MVSRVIPVDPFDLVIFGGTGDLARRYLSPPIPADYVVLATDGSQINGDRTFIQMPLAKS